MCITCAVQEAMRTLLPLVLVFCDEEEELAPPVGRLAGVMVVAMVVALAVLVVDALADGDGVVDVDDTLSFFWLDMVAVDDMRRCSQLSPTHLASAHRGTHAAVTPLSRCICNRIDTT
jgi:hypothetical protein